MFPYNKIQVYILSMGSQLQKYIMWTKFQCTLIFALSCLANAVSFDFDAWTCNCLPILTTKISLKNAGPMQARPFLGDREGPPANPLRHRTCKTGHTYTCEETCSFLSKMKPF
jgi:hypothetical protein